MGCAVIKTDDITKGHLVSDTCMMRGFVSEGLYLWVKSHISFYIRYLIQDKTNHHIVYHGIVSFTVLSRFVKEHHK